MRAITATIATIVLLLALAPNAAAKPQPPLQPDPSEQAWNLRIDNLTLEELDQALQQRGLPEAVRTQQLEREQARREGKIPTPKLDATNTTNRSTQAIRPQGIGVPWATGCTDGQGCVINWAGRGGMRTRWSDWYTGYWPWTAYIICPPATTCVMMSRSPSTQPWRRWWAMQADSFGSVPVMVGGPVCYWP